MDKMDNGIGMDKMNNGKPVRTETIDEAINKIGESPNWLMFLIASVAMSCSFVGSICAYMIEFTGFIPTEDYECISKKCFDVKADFTDQFNILDRRFYKTDTICDNKMAFGVDFKWEIDRTTIAIEFDRICKSSDLSLLNSLYFVGGTVGLMFGTVAFELLGRRKTSMLGGLTCTIGTFIGLFCHSYEFMVVIRLLQGAGNFVAYAGAYIWVLEFVPEKWRILYNSWSMLIWALGYPILVCICYFIHNWNYIHLASAIVILLTYIPLRFLPDSPRYLLSIGKAEEAKRVLLSYSKLAGKSMDFDGVNLVTGKKPSTEGKITTKTRLRDFLTHNAMLLETAVQMYTWFVCALLFYFLNYGWGSFGDTPYVNYLFAGLGETIAYLALIPITMFMGRKIGMIFSLGAACACFLLGMIPWQWTDVWNFERLMTLVAIVAISCAFGLVFLYTNELAPTTHRGLVMSLCSVVARAGAFMGPFASQISKKSTVRLTVNAFLAGSAALLLFLLPETRQIPIPEEAKYVSSRRKEQGLVELCRQKEPRGSAIPNNTLSV